MGLDKAIEHGKEHRSKYYGSKAIDRTCRNHGGCTYCEESRQHRNKVEQAKFDEKISEWMICDDWT